MNPRDAITGRQLNRRPHVTAGLQIDHRFTARFAAGASLTYAGKTYDDAANTVPLAPYLLINARASYRFTPKLTGSVTVDNLFDRHYVTAAGYNQPGCTGFARLTYTF
jgi:vitamin B12 transporter